MKVQIFCCKTVWHHCGRGQQDHHKACAVPGYRLCRCRCWSRRSWLVVAAAASAAPAGWAAAWWGGRATRRGGPWPSWARWSPRSPAASHSQTPPPCRWWMAVLCPASSSEALPPLPGCRWRWRWRSPTGCTWHWMESERWRPSPQGCSRRAVAPPPPPPPPPAVPPPLAGHPAPDGRAAAPPPRWWHHPPCCGSGGWPYGRHWGEGRGLGERNGGETRERVRRWTNRCKPIITRVTDKRQLCHQI